MLWLTACGSPVESAAEEATDRFEPAFAHALVELGKAPRDYVPVEREPLGIGQLSASAGDLVLSQTEVHADISSGLALVRVAQHFHNPFDETLEATYTLPLPPDAAVRGFELACGGRVVEGQIKEKAEAARLYREARDSGRKAALIEQARENLFTQAVAGICPGEDVSVTVEYVQQVARDHGRYSLVFPTTVGERYGDTPGYTVPTHVKAPKNARDLDIEVVLHEDLPLQSLWSDTHAIDIFGEDGTGAQVLLDEVDDVPNKDFVLSWTVASDAPLATTAVHPPIGSEPGYLTLTLEPQVLTDVESQRARELLFVLDSSCSMRGEPWQMAVDTVSLALDEMGPQDTFNLVRFSSAASSIFAEPSPPPTRTWPRPRRG